MPWPEPEVGAGGVRDDRDEPARELDHELVEQPQQEPQHGLVPPAAHPVLELLEGVPLAPVARLAPPPSGALAVAGSALAAVRPVGPGRRLLGEHVGRGAPQQAQEAQQREGGRGPVTLRTLTGMGPCSRAPGSTPDAGRQGRMLAGFGVRWRIWACWRSWACC